MAPQSNSGPADSSPRPESTFAQATETTLQSLPLAVVPLLASLLSPAKIATVLSKPIDGGVSFPVPSGLPTLWSFVQANGLTVSGSGGAGLSPFVWLPLFAVGLLIASALEAGFVGAVANRLDGESADFLTNVTRYGRRMIGVNLVRFAVVLLALPFIVFGPLAILVVVGLEYLVYGLPFVVVVERVGVVEGLSQTTSYALSASPEYVGFGVAYLIVGAVTSFVLTGFVYGTGIVGILVGSVLVAVPAVFVVAYGLLVFRALAAGEV